LTPVETTRMVDLKRWKRFAVVACGGGAISSASCRAQEPQDLFLRCSVVMSCFQRLLPSPLSSCGRSTETRNYPVSFRQRTISALSDDQETYSITTLTASLIEYEQSSTCDNGGMAYNLDINGITGGFKDWYVAKISDALLRKLAREIVKKGSFPRRETKILAKWVRRFRQSVLSEIGGPRRTIPALDPPHR
jgi:hypothetical protein